MIRRPTDQGKDAHLVNMKKLRRYGKEVVSGFDSTFECSIRLASYILVYVLQESVIGEYLVYRKDS